MCLPIYGIAIIFLIGVVNGIAIMSGVAGILASKKINEVAKAANILSNR